MDKQEDKYKDGEEHNKESADDVYDNENDNKNHVKSVQKFSLDTYKSVGELQSQSLIQSLCKASPQISEIVVDCQYYNNFNMRDMVKKSSYL